MNYNNLIDQHALFRDFDNLVKECQLDPSVLSISPVRGNIAKQIGVAGHEDELFVITDQLRGTQYQLSVSKSRYEILVPIKDGHLMVTARLESDPLEVIELVERQFGNSVDSD